MRLTNRTSSLEVCLKIARSSFKVRLKFVRDSLEAVWVGTPMSTICMANWFDSSRTHSWRTKKRFALQNSRPKIWKLPATLCRSLTVLKFEVFKHKHSLLIWNTLLIFVASRLITFQKIKPCLTKCKLSSAYRLNFLLWISSQWLIVTPVANFPSFKLIKADSVTMAFDGLSDNRSSLILDGLEIFFCCPDIWTTNKFWVWISDS